MEQTDITVLLQEFNLVESEEGFVVDNCKKKLNYKIKANKIFLI